MIIVLEGIVMCFILLIVCVIGIANGPVGLVVFYENNVKKRVVELGLTTEKAIKRNALVSSVILMLAKFFLIPVMVCFINGARDFTELFWQMSVILWIMGLFDRIFIDWYWVGHTKAWLIPGTEDLMPYIPKKTLIVKWLSAIVGSPVISAVTSAIIVSLN